MMDHEVSNDLDLELDEAPELSLEQQLSRMRIQDLRQEATRRGLSGGGNTPTLIGRIVTYEDNGGVIPEGDVLELKPGIAPSPVEPTTQQPAAGEVNSASAPAAGNPPSRRTSRQKTGFFEGTNTYRSEFPLGPRGTIDDTTHMQFIEDTHAAAVNDGYRSLGAPHAGKRIGWSTINVNGQLMKSVIYEVYARQVED
jgi:hypothetical protein